MATVTVIEFSGEEGDRAYQAICGDPIVASRANHRCEYCGAPESIFNFPFEVEHFLPPSLGGSNDANNLPKKQLAGPIEF